MVLVDTSVWVDHLRRGNSALAGLLNEGQVLCHPFVIGELACGNLKQRDEILRLLGALAATPVAEHDEVLAFLHNERLHGGGLGLIDVHLLASARLMPCPLLTLDKRLKSAAEHLKLVA
jgi:hypothetical protein